MGRRLITVVDVLMLFPEPKYILICCRGQRYGFDGSLKTLLKDNLVVNFFFFGLFLFFVLQ